MIHPPQISIIIINYNGAKYLSKLLDSIQSNHTPSHEVIIVDNSSTDKSVELILQRYPHLKLITSPNIGYGRGCNLGARHSRGKYLLFLNPDTYLASDTLNCYLHAYQSLAKIHSKQIGCLCARHVDFGQNPNTSPPDRGGIIDIFGNPQISNNLARIGDSFYVFGTGLFINRQLFIKSGGFNPNIFLYGEEIDLCWRLKIMGYRHSIVNQGHFFHLGGGSFGSHRPRQVALMTYGSFIASFTNYQLVTLCLVMPLYLLYLLTLLAFLPKYRSELLKTFGSLLTDKKQILSFRRQVQINRSTSDLDLIKYLSPIPSIITRLPFVHNLLFRQPIQTSL